MTDNYDDVIEIEQDADGKFAIRSAGSLITRKRFKTEKEARKWLENNP